METPEEFLKHYHNNLLNDWLFEKREVVARLIKEYTEQAFTVHLYHPKVKTKYKATVQKGQGDDFFEWEVFVEAQNIAEAAKMVHDQVKDFGGWTFAIEQDDDAVLS